MAHGTANVTALSVAVAAAIDATELSSYSASFFAIETAQLAAI